MSIIVALGNLFVLIILFIITNPLVLIITLVVIAMCYAGWWNMFEKAGYEGWKCLIPFYNSYIAYEMAFGEGRGWVCLVSYIPYLSTVIAIVFVFKTAKAFGKHVGYAFGLAFLPPVFLMLLGFGDAYYEGVW